MLPLLVLLLLSLSPVVMAESPPYPKQLKKKLLRDGEVLQAQQDFEGARRKYLLVEQIWPGAARQAHSKLQKAIDAKVKRLLQEGAIAAARNPEQNDVVVRTMNEALSLSED